MMEFRADLHCHSTCSDGTDSPERLIELACELGLSGLSITDHDTLDAYKTAVEAAKKHALPLLTGVEFSTHYENTPIHVLAYAFPLESPSLLALCQRHKVRRTNRNRRILENLKQLGISISEEELKGKGTIGRPHIAQRMIELGIVKSVKEAFHKYLGEGRPAYDPGKQISTEETLSIIHESGGKAILAHPHLIRRRKLLRFLLDMPFDGLEGYYGSFPLHKERPWIERATKKGWIITGGSDYHGSVKPESRLGSSWVGKETFEVLYAHYCSHKTL